MALPSLNTFAGNPLDRAGDRRNEPDWLAEQAGRPDALALVLWEGRPLLEDHADGPRLAWLSLEHARAVVPDREAFLGLWMDAPCFAVEGEGSVDPATGPVAGLGAFHEMREAAALLLGPEAAMAGAAKSLFDWRRRHGFCAACGIESQTASGGWRRICPACATEHFPRVDPVTIMLPVFRGGDEPRCLLGRQASWPEGRMSALAGFLEPGETIEDAVRRETFEEAGIRVGAVRYLASQPWPFPSNIMIGCIGEALTEDINFDGEELEDARWFSRDDVRRMLEGTHEDFAAPSPIAIANHLLREWVKA